MTIRRTQLVGARVAAEELAWLDKDADQLDDLPQARETAKEKKSQIELDLIASFGDFLLDGLDRFTLQTHLNRLAEHYSQDRVKQARSYLKSIFDEAIEQEVSREGSKPEA